LKRILIIQEIIPHYRIPLFQIISKKSEIQLSVACDSQKTLDSNTYNFCILRFSKNKIWKFTYIKNIKQLIKGFDQIIIIGNLYWFPTFLNLLLLKGKAKLFFWGIGVSSEKGLTKKPFLDKFRFLLNDLSSGTILYSQKVANYYIKNVKKKDQIYIAPNTLYVEKFPFPTVKRTKIISIGSFKKNKKLENLIIAFNRILEIIPTDISLDLIGDGEEEDNLKQLVYALGLEERVVFWGRVEDNREIYPIISKALVCVSPNQAGLSVLHAMAFGCPFLTSTNAITGGELYNIVDNMNGYLYDGTIKSLIGKIIYIIKNQDANLKVAKTAYDFYHEFRNISQYGEAFSKIINSN
jgi:glycosyltransferase involved in cell wall biosynthesis